MRWDCLVKWKCQRSTIILSVDIKYSMSDLSVTSITVRDPQRCVMSYEVNWSQRSLLASVALASYEIHTYTIFYGNSWRNFFNLCLLSFLAFSLQFYHLLVYSYLSFKLMTSQYLCTFLILHIYPQIRLKSFYWQILIRVSDYSVGAYYLGPPSTVVFDLVQLFYPKVNLNWGNFHKTCTAKIL